MNDCRFDLRAPMSYRATLRTIPKSLHRPWWQQRYQFREPRVAISRLWLLTHREM
ncbi:hypothetical protein [Paraburkholderia adhaesiva]|uniref:hypothetical protein n=1 Tax=Paraburkholderia adhaesiva TaxID=2883244 RepID=UPI001F1B30E1|nr:hypothetical protein [Paraburkholderia adhaesiva]